MSHNVVDTSEIQLKGTSFGIRVVFPTDLPDDVLLEKFEAIPGDAYVLPVGTGVVLDFQSRPCPEELIRGILSRVVWPGEINVLAWLTSDEDSSSRLRRGGFQTEEPAAEQPLPENGEETLVLSQSLRSGRHEESSGNVLLIGHLNSGAEIYAGKSVFVLGSLKGLVHAGRSGTEGVFILAGSFEARQLRIGDRLCSQFGPDMKWWKKPVIITLEKDGLLFRDWKMEMSSETA